MDKGSNLGIQSMRRELLGLVSAVAFVASAGCSESPGSGADSLVDTGVLPSGSATGTDTTGTTTDATAGPGGPGTVPGSTTSPGATVTAAGPTGTGPGGTQPGGTGTASGGPTGTVGPITPNGAGGTGGTGGNGPTGGMGGAPSAAGGMFAAGGAGGTGMTGGDPPTKTPPDLVPLVTSARNAYWQEGELREASGGNATVTVNESQTFQTWDGWGGTFNEAGWDALKVVTQEERDRVMRLLFDPAEGCGFTQARIPIGSSDYGLSRYSLNETAGDYEMNDFSIERDKQDLIPYIKAALAVNPDIWLWASAWSPPTWMKSNNAFDRGSMKSDQQTYQAHALYLARFVEEYADLDINVRAVVPQNEPGYPQDYPSCSWSADQYVDYIGNYLGPTLQERGLDTEVWLGTMSNPSSASIVSAVMGNGTAKGFVKGIGLQWGMGDNNRAGDIVRQYGIPVMQTEHQCGNFPSGGNSTTMAPNDHAYGVESWNLFKKWLTQNINSYSAWNMVLDTAGRNLDMVRPWAQNALIAVDRNAKTLNVTPYYYVFRHFAQYVHPGATRVGTQGGDALAFENTDGTIAVIMYNSGGGNTTTVSVGGKMYEFDMPGDGWATVLHKP